MTGVFTTFISCFVNAYPNKQLIDYSYFEQMKDLCPSFLAAITMFLCVLAAGRLPLGLFAVLVVQIITGVAVYLLISVLGKLKPFELIWQMISSKIGKKGK